MELFPLKRVLVWMIASVVLIAPPAPAQSRLSASEHAVQAAHLVEFGRYVAGFPPAGTRGSFEICVLGKDPFGPMLDTVAADKTIEGLRIIVRRVISVTESRDCRVLFVSRSEVDRLPAILRDLDGRQVLTVGEGSQFTRRGGMIGFTVLERRVRFAVNLAAVEAAQLSLGAQLLRLAASVER